ncbi:MAG: hypothetical protein JW982_05125 [Spirochaetes bacterium]|nr:hypothetical protein [Spirochaetota bacterium]
MSNRKFLTVTLIVLITGFVYTLLFGKLSFLSPVAAGFDKHELTNSVVYIQKGSKFTDYDEIDKYTEAVESFHRLKFLKKPEIYIYSDKNMYLRRNMTKARFYAYPNGRLVVAPWAVDESRAGTISLEIYIKHELSHVLLYENMSYIAAYRYPQWLMEGIAVYSTNQMGTSWYPGKKETYEIIKSGDYFPPYLYKTRKEDSIEIKTKNRIAFMYSEFACIVDFLITEYGMDKFHQYMNSLFTDYDHDEVFEKIYGIGFESFLNNFLANVQK